MFEQVHCLRKSVEGPRYIACGFTNHHFENPALGEFSFFASSVPIYIVANLQAMRRLSSVPFRRTVNNRLEEAEFTPSERACLLGHTPDTNIRHYTNPRKQATLTKFRNAFCVRYTFGTPNNVIEFKSKKPKNREFSGFSKNTISAGSRT